MIRAASNGDIDAVQALLAAGVNVDATDNKGRTPLIEAIREAAIASFRRGETGRQTDRGPLAIVETLLAAGANVNATDYYEGTSFTVLMYAAGGGYTEIVQTLLAAGADTELRSDSARTALIEAASLGRTDAVQALLAQGADLNAKSDSGLTALIAAAWTGHTDTVETLLAHRADVVTAAQQLLVEAYKGDTAAVEALLAQGTDVNAQNGWTPLMAAACAGRTDTVQTLLDRGARVNAKGWLGRTALMWAARKGHTDGVQTLLAHGADVNAKNNYGWTALIWAAQQGHTETVETLLAAGADVNAEDKYGWTALKRAEQKGHTDMVRLLKTTSVQQPSPPSKVKPPTTLPGKKEKPAASQPTLDLKPGHVKLNPKDGLEYVWIPPGTFQMGCVPQDDQCSGKEYVSFGGSEYPRHPVEITKGFWMGRTEVPVGAYKQFVSKTDGVALPESSPEFNPGWKEDTHPIFSVTWDEAKAYCEWAGGRLPTEAEWEYAARGGRDGLKYPWGNDITQENANYDAKGTSSVGSYPANGFGLYDMAGNVWERVADWYDEDYYGSLPQDSPSPDPLGPAEEVPFFPPGMRGKRVLRGGVWYLDPEYLRVSYRQGHRPYAGVGSIGIGFRCAREVFP